MPETGNDIAETVMELPPYRAVLVVDTKEFGRNSEVGQQLLADTIDDVLTLAFERAGLAHVWHERTFPHNTGDGVGFGFDPRYLPLVVPAVFDTLQDVLAERDARLRSRGREIRLRMRASINVGPVRAPDETGKASVVGTTVVTTHRLLDAPPVRDLLGRSDPDQTFLVVAISQRIFDDVLSSGLTKLTPARVVPQSVTIKEVTGAVYLYVPRPSGDLLRSGFGIEREIEADVDKGSGRELAPGSEVNTTNSFSGAAAGTVLMAGQIHGNVHSGADQSPYRSAEYRDVNGGRRATGGAW
jgi:hypothetical protein